MYKQNLKKYVISYSKLSRNIKSFILLAIAVISFLLGVGIYQILPSRPEYVYTGVNEYLYQLYLFLILLSFVLSHLGCLFLTVSKR
jgi:uncharacterized protein YqhQ